MQHETENRSRAESRYKSAGEELRGTREELEQEKNQGPDK